MLLTSVISAPYHQRPLYQVGRPAAAVPPLQPLYFGAASATTMHGTQYGNSFSNGAEYSPEPIYTNPAVTMPYHQAPAGYPRTIYPPVFAGGTSFAPDVNCGLPPLQQQAADQSLNNIDPRLRALSPSAAPTTSVPNATFDLTLALLSARQAPGQAPVAAGSSGAPVAAQVRQKRKYTRDPEGTGPKTRTERKPRATKKAKTNATPALAPIPAHVPATQTPGQAYVAASFGVPAAVQVRRKRKHTSTSEDPEGTDRTTPMKMDPQTTKKAKYGPGYD